ncbi:YbaK/EbsC family protein [Kribbella shirazensis]|uniref:Ala-tRNA(Pro) deacylase n=1 Tax=Kribbella shirazensis TaxID=1105143 RepID=A0A7X6A2C4_9ACTN|nr:YbaK/EbsC family protein [Kribbella shirazensis]NIK58084.1 Ala-tRNA(Pro) deacylase [Kribbella shirazensis]
MPDPDTYRRLIELLDEAAVSYKLIDHEPEGTTEKVSGLRGHPVSLAAKCIILIVKPDKRTTRHVLAVVPGDCRVDLDAIKQLYGARYVGFADHATAERLARTVPGTVLPFSLDPALELIADPAVIAEPEIYFNAARLDRSIMLSGADYKTLARPRIEPIALPQSK